ncbi:NAD-dependent epimerase/dehydratase family protein [Nonomuraea sp. B12E4]|uniref:NAD-dependent epimerase/dehydratase family protein n=1 Tax=Nonomuraea sp. B12E4 TaxID=3153564 RepID=UPI00325DF906
MPSLKVLFIGGSGIISSACSWLAVARGIDLSVLNRGHSTHRPLPPETTTLRADIRDPGSALAALGDREFDVVVNWVAYTPQQVQADIDMFRGRTGQYVFISSASAYQTPPGRVPIVESTPLRNPFLEYSRNKIACEDLLVAAHRDDGFRRRSYGRRTRTTGPGFRSTAAGRPSPACGRRDVRHHRLLISSSRSLIEFSR